MLIDHPTAVVPGGARTMARPAARRYNPFCPHSSIGTPIGKATEAEARTFPAVPPSVFGHVASVESCATAC